jgi:hypothetical protein
VRPNTTTHERGYTRSVNPREKLIHVPRNLNLAKRPAETDGKLIPILRTKPHTIRDIPIKLQHILNPKVA